MIEFSWESYVGSGKKKVFSCNSKPFTYLNHLILFRLTPQRRFTNWLDFQNTN